MESMNKIDRSGPSTELLSAQLNQTIRVFHIIGRLSHVEKLFSTAYFMPRFEVLLKLHFLLNCSLGTSQSTSTGAASDA